MDNSNILISVIVPVYNAIEHLDRCVNSILSQTFSEIEIILVDDCSTDGSPELIKRYGDEYPSIIVPVYRERNSGGAGAINDGIKMARGHYIIQVDNDDYIEPSMLEKLYKESIKESADIVDCDIKYIDEKGKEVGIEVSNTLNQIGSIDEEKRKSLIIHPGRRFSKLYDRNFLLENQIEFPENIGYGDNYYAGLFSMYVNKIAKVNEPLYCYCMNDASTTRSFNNPGVYDRCKSAEALVQELKRRGFYNKYKEEIDYRFFELYYLGSIYTFVSKFRPAERKQLKLIRDYMKRNYPDYRENKYYKLRLGRVDRMVCALNDITPNIVIACYSLLNFKLGKKLFNFIN